MKSDVVD